MKPRLDRRLSFVLGAVAALGLLGLGCGGGVKVTSVTPDTGTVAGGEDILIKGEGFKAGVNVKFCRAEAKNVILLGDTQIKAQSPANEKGMCDITLTFDDGRAYKVDKAFRYQAPGDLLNPFGTKGGQKAPPPTKK